MQSASLFSVICTHTKLQLGTFSLTDIFTLKIVQNEL